jgi:very-short-patch-repair endonuclease
LWSQIIDDDGYFVGTPDLAYLVQKIAIEYEGEVHQSDPRVCADDIERRERMEEAGWLVIRVISRHVTSRHAQLIRRVATALATRPAASGR